MNTKLFYSSNELNAKVIQFYANYYDEIECYKNFIIKHLQNLVIAYSKENNLPEGSVIVLARIKTLNSLLRKLKYNGWPQFDFLTEIITDLIGTRITCLFLSDCYGIIEYLKRSKFFKIINIENYNDEPKKSGYRAIHLSSTLHYGVKINGITIDIPFKIPFTFEIQVKTKLQEAWGEITHEFYLRSKTENINKKYESVFKRSADKLFKEDKVLDKCQIIYRLTMDSTINRYLKKL